MAAPLDAAQVRLEGEPGRPAGCARGGGGRTRASRPGARRPRGRADSVPGQTERPADLGARAHAEAQVRRHVRGGVVARQVALAGRRRPRRASGRTPRAARARPRDPAGIGGVAAREGRPRPAPGSEGPAIRSGAGMCSGTGIARPDAAERGEDPVAAAAGPRQVARLDEQVAAGLARLDADGPQRGHHPPVARAAERGDLPDVGDRRRARLGRRRPGRPPRRAPRARRGANRAPGARRRGPRAPRAGTAAGRARGGGAGPGSRRRGRRDRHVALPRGTRQAGMVGDPQVAAEPDDGGRRGVRRRLARRGPLLQQLGGEAVARGEGARQLALHRERDRPAVRAGRAGGGRRRGPSSACGRRRGDRKTCSWRQYANGERSATSTIRVGHSTVSIRSRQVVANGIGRWRRRIVTTEPGAHREASRDLDDGGPGGRDQPGVARVEVESEDLLDRGRDLHRALEPRCPGHPPSLTP